MAFYYLRCNALETEQVLKFPPFAADMPMEIDFPITATDLEIDILVTGSAVSRRTRLAATISDWSMPPVTLFIIETSRYETLSEELRHHPRVGRTIFFCKDESESIREGLEAVYSFYLKRKSLDIDNSVSGNYSVNNVSPRWLFQTMMEHLDEYIYFKDRESKFLAVSRYLTESCGKQSPQEVLGLTDFELFDEEHAQDAQSDELKIATGQLSELYKEEHILKNGKDAWVSSRKLPLHTRSKYLAGSFGLSRDITEQKELNEELKKNHERMQSELLLARNLQDTLMKQNVPSFSDSDGGSCHLEVSTKYIPSFHLSGDFFSIKKTPAGNAAILLADVMGHGVRAAMVTAMIQIAVQQLQQYSNKPKDFMEHLNAMIQKSMQPAGQTIFATAVYCYINLETKRMTYAQAGARHGAYIPSGDAKKAVPFSMKTIAPALGLLPEIEFEENTIQLKSGDEVLLYTDGIIEAADKEEEYSEKRMLDLLMEHRQDKLPDMIEELLKSVKEFTHSDELEDDVCLIGLRIP